MMMRPVYRLRSRRGTGKSADLWLLSALGRSASAIPSSAAKVEVARRSPADELILGMRTAILRGNQDTLLWYKFSGDAVRLLETGGLFDSKEGAKPCQLLQNQAVLHIVALLASSRLSSVRCSFYRRICRHLDGVITPSSVSPRAAAALVVLARCFARAGFVDRHFFAHVLPVGVHLNLHSSSLEDSAGVHAAAAVYLASAWNSARMLDAPCARRTFLEDHASLVAALEATAQYIYEQGPGALAKLCTEKAARLLLSVGAIERVILGSNPEGFPGGMNRRKGRPECNSSLRCITHASCQSQLGAIHAEVKWCLWNSVLPRMVDLAPETHLLLIRECLRPRDIEALSDRPASVPEQCDRVRPAGLSGETGAASRDPRHLTGMMGHSRSQAYMPGIPSKETLAGAVVRRLGDASLSALKCNPDLAAAPACEAVARLARTGVWKRQYIFPFLERLVPVLVKDGLDRASCRFIRYAMRCLGVCDDILERALDDKSTGAVPFRLLLSRGAPVDARCSVVTQTPEELGIVT